MLMFMGLMLLICDYTLCVTHLWLLETGSIKNTCMSYLDYCHNCLRLQTRQCCTQSMQSYAHHTTGRCCHLFCRSLMLFRCQAELFIRCLRINSLLLEGLYWKLMKEDMYKKEFDIFFLRNFVAGTGFLVILVSGCLAIPRINFLKI
mmetsp:Transcript_115915/g.201230  ORF Transcript_115915/g.201230 Transcript_115915/m.201230 type:complete len:147 (-) Transcript_115915:582-1022(-)